jgi:membrane protein DedA with SNARE-associated domain/rhodanese-related sulfurtransferase
MANLTVWLEHVGVLAVFALVLVEQIGLPLPTYPLLIVAGAWSVQGGAPFVRIVAAGVSACLLADLGWYTAGRRFGSRVLRLMCRLTLEPDSCVSVTERVFERFGTRVLVLAKFIPGLGAVATAMSGVVAASLFGFVVYDAIGATIWTATGVAIGALFHDAVDSVFAELAALGRFGAVLILGLLALFLVLKAWRRHLFFQQLRMNRISVEELGHRLREGPALIVVDARSQSSRLREGMIPGAIEFETLLQERETAQRPESRGEVVVYCACPNEATSARIARKLMSLGFQPVRPLAGGIHAWQDAGFEVVLAPAPAVTGPARA